MNQIDENNDSERQVEWPSTAQGASQTRRRFVSGSLSVAPVLLALQSSSALAGTCRTPSRMMSGNLSNHGDKSTCMAGRSPGYWVQPQKFSEWRVSPPSLQIRTSSDTWVDDTTGPPALEKFKYSTKPPTKDDCRVKPQYDADPLSGTIYFGAYFDDIFIERRNLIAVLPYPVKSSELSTKLPVVDTARKICFWEILAYPNQTLGLSGGPNDGSDNLAQLARHCIAAYLNARMAEATSQFYPIRSDQAIDMWIQGSLGGYCAIENCSAPWSAGQIISYIQSTFG